MLYPNAYEGVKGLRIPMFWSVLVLPLPLLFFLLYYLLPSIEMLLDSLYLILPLIFCAVFFFLNKPLSIAQKDEILFMNAKRSAVLVTALSGFDFACFCLAPGFFLGSALILSFAIQLLAARCMCQTLKAIVQLAIRLDGERVYGLSIWIHRLALGMLACSIASIGGMFLFSFFEAKQPIVFLIATILSFLCTAAELMLLPRMICAARSMLSQIVIAPDREVFSGASVLAPEDGYQKSDWQRGKGFER